jgi:hypothetical protein
MSDTAGLTRALAADLAPVFRAHAEALRAAGDVGARVLAGAIAEALAAAGVSPRMGIKPATRSDRLVALLAAEPGRPIGALARDVYGADSEHDRARVRALLSQLRRQGRVRRTEPARWEAAEPPDGRVEARDVEPVL